MLLSLSVRNIRSYDLASYDIDPSITLILGKNGSGKTTLLEAIYVLLRGSSFRGRDKDMLAHAAEDCEIKLVLTGDQIRRVRLSVAAETTVKKAFSVDDRDTMRLPAKHRLPVVLFEPDELRLLSTSPQRRRQFIDDILSRLYPEYATILSRYNRTLLQRNELLKQRHLMSTESWDSHLFVWDVKFAELAEQIVEKRLAFIATSNERLSAIYSEMADSKHEIFVVYSQPVELRSYKQFIMKKLSTLRYTDADRGFTSTGPHRDDIDITLDGYAATETASRGEMRTIMLAYKLLEVILQQELSGMKPIILMDDVFSELDVTREQHLMKSLKGYQTIITATDLRDDLKIDATTITL